MRSVDVKPLVLGLCAVAATAGGPALAGNFVYTTIDAPGADATYPVSINDRGGVAGVYTTSHDSPQYGFVWLNGIVTTFTAHNVARSLGVAGIDNRGTVAFTASDIRSGGSHAKLRYIGGGRRVLPTPEGVVAWTSGINARGQVVGAYEPTIGGTTRTGFLFQKGQLQQLVFPGAALTTPSAISNDGTVIGAYSAGDADPAHGFTYQNGSYQEFDPPGSTYTIANSINPHGDIAGTFYTAALGTGTLGFVLSDGKYHIYAVKRGKEYVNEVKWAGPADQVAGNFYNLVNEIAFTYVHGQYYQVLPLGSVNSYIYAGNRQGTLVGIYAGADGVIHGFVATCPAGQAPCTN
jgi:probable HAF family extracellular repeat protein